MSDFEKFLQWKKYTSTNPKELLDQSIKNTSLIRKDLLIQARILCLLPLCEPINHPSIFPDNQNFYQYISQSPEILKDLIPPQHIQFISKIYDFFLQNPFYIVKLIQIVESKHSELLSFFTYSIIPSFFGYFSCIENMRFAFSFYCCLITQSSKKIVAHLLKPFFCNSTTSNFIEKLSNDVINFFCQDIRLLNQTKYKMESIIKEHSTTFLNSIFANMSLLPDVHLQILQFMEKLQWTSIEIFRLFLSIFVIPELLNYLSYSYLSFSFFIESFQSMIAFLKKNVTKQQLSPFLKSTSIYELPSAFTDFAVPFLDLVLTPLDAAILFEVALPEFQLPKLTLMLQNPKFLGRQQPYSPIFIKIFLKMPKPILDSETWRNLIFNFQSDLMTDPPLSPLKKSTIEKEEEQDSILNPNRVIEDEISLYNNSEPSPEIPENSGSTRHVLAPSDSGAHLIITTTKQASNESPFYNRRFCTTSTELKKPVYDIPHFKRKYRMLHDITDKLNCCVYDIIQGKTIPNNPAMIQLLRDETAIDLNSLCENCKEVAVNKSIENINVDRLCSNCKSVLLSESHNISFHQYALNSELYHLQKKGLLFEKFLIHEFAAKRLVNWVHIFNGFFKKQIISKAETIFNHYFSMNPIGKVVKKKETVQTVLRNYPSYFYTKKIEKMFYLYRNEKLLSYFKEKDKQYLKKLDLFETVWKEEKWNLISKTSFHQTFSMCKKIVAFEIISTISNTMNVFMFIPFHERFFRLRACLKYFLKIKNITNYDFGSSIVDCFLKHAIDSSFLLFVLQISATIMKSSSFLALCSAKESLLWYELDSKIPTALESSPKLLKLYNSLHDHLVELICAIQ